LYIIMGHKIVPQILDLALPELFWMWWWREEDIEPHWAVYRPEVPKLGGVVGLLQGGVDCMRDILILNEIWPKVKIYILVANCFVEIFYLSLSTGTGSEL
jgi:hypothetical protein